MNTFSIKICTLLSLTVIATGCSLNPTSRFSENNQITTERAYPAPPPGTSTVVWEEPMVDVVSVPPGLDPEGNYYRPSHQEVIEIRQGRWQYYKD